MIIAIDFDGTITDHSFPEIGKQNPGAIKWIKRFIELDADIILHTMRSGSHLSDAKKYLLDNGVPELYGYNNNPDQHFWTNSPKTYANVYIDDAAYGCPLTSFPGFRRVCVNWNIVGPDVEQMIIDNQL